MSNSDNGRTDSSGARKPVPRKPAPRAINCESCEYYDYDEDWGENVCRVELDEDEMLRFLTGTNSSCPYYKLYDEYKSVQKQN